MPQISSSDPAQGAHSEAKRGISPSRFIRAVQTIIKGNPILSMISVLLLFLVGWFAEKGLDTLYAQFFPDARQLHAEVLREKISKKTDTIAAQMELLENSIANLDGSDDQAKAFMAEAQSVVQELQSLRPEISQFAEDADMFTARLASAKAVDLSQTGQSSQADFILPLNGGMTLCSDRFTFGVTNTSRSDSVILRLSKAGDNNRRIAAVGESLRLDGEASSVSVSYLGPTDDGNLHRFNFSCVSA